MKPLLAAALAACLSFATAPVSLARAGPAASYAQLRIIGLNDLHGHLLPPMATPAGQAQRGGAVEIDRTIRTLRDGVRHSITVASGDMIGASPLESSLFFDEPTVEVLNALGLDIGVLGNHEFDRGMAELLRMRSGGCATRLENAQRQSCRGPSGTYTGAKFAMLAANVIDRSGKRPFPAYAVRRIEGIPVAFIGVLTRTTPSLVPPAGIAGLRFLDEAATVNAQVRRLRREQGIRAFIVLIHEGGFVDPADHALACPTASGPVFALAKQMDPDVRIVISGHTHQEYRCVRDGKLITQAGSYGKTLSKIDVALDRRTKTISLEQTLADNLPVMSTPGQEPPATNAVSQLVAHYHAMARPLAEQEIALINETFDRQGIDRANSTMGALVADAQLAATAEPGQGGAQLALMNAGGLRADLSCERAPCKVRYGDVISAQPFANQLVTMSLTGRQLREVLEDMARRPRLSLLAPSAGFVYEVDLMKEPGARITGMVLHGQPISPDHTYRVTVNSFLAEGGDGLAVLKTGTRRVTGAIDAEALVAYLKTGERVPDRVARIVVKRGSEAP